MARRARRSTSYHEGGHAVAAYFFPLAGKTRGVTMHPDDLADHNAQISHPINHASGFYSRGRTLPAIVGLSVDREQIHHELILLLAGPAAEWVFRGESPRLVQPDPRKEEEFRKHSDGGDDESRVLNRLFAADEFDLQSVLRSIPEHERRRSSKEELMRRYVDPAAKARDGKILVEFESLWREALAFVVEKWPHVQALADMLWTKRRLSGDEVNEIIERAEMRTHELPPHLAEEIQMVLRERGEEKG
jgi:hypothetical protein